MARRWKMPGAGYFWTGADIETFEPLSHWVVVRERLVRLNPAGIILPNVDHNMIGDVVAAGPESGVRAGDTVVYEEWQGGRWAFKDRKVDGGVSKLLIMASDNLSCLVT